MPYMLPFINGYKAGSLCRISIETRHSLSYLHIYSRSYKYLCCSQRITSKPTRQTNILLPPCHASITFPTLTFHTRAPSFTSIRFNEHFPLHTRTLSLTSIRWLVSPMLLWCTTWRNTSTSVAINTATPKRYRCPHVIICTIGVYGARRRKYRRAIASHDSALGSGVRILILV